MTAVTYLSSSISRLDSLSDRCLHSASLLSVSICSFLCNLKFSCLICFSSSNKAAIFFESTRSCLSNHTQPEDKLLYYFQLNSTFIFTNIKDPYSWNHKNKPKARVSIYAQIYFYKKVTIVKIITSKKAYNWCLCDPLLLCYQRLLLMFIFW